MKALLIVDIQNDFCPGGALAIPNGDEIINTINNIRDEFEEVIFTLDTHPNDHCSFKENGGKWPAHCVLGLKGQQLHPELDNRINDIMIVKGMDRNIDSYSGFVDNANQKTIMDTLLKAREIDELYICGLATEYCVLFTAMDAINLGYKITIIEDACKGISEKEVIEALQKLKENGANIITSKELKK